MSTEKRSPFRQAIDAADQCKATVSQTGMALLHESGPTIGEVYRTQSRRIVDLEGQLQQALAERGELISALQACVKAAADDVVEDFSNVSNAADAAIELLAKLSAK